MAITFAVRGHQLKPYYAADTTFGAISNGITPLSISDAGAIGGSTLDLGTNGIFTQHRVHYNGIGNWPSTKQFSALIRFYLYDNTVAVPLFFCGGGGRANLYSYGGFEIKYNSTNFIMSFSDATTLVGINAVNFAHGGLSNATYYDLLITGTGDTTANGFKVYLNGTLLGSTTSTRSWSDPREKVYNALILGGANNAANTYIRINEFVLFNTIESATPYIGAARTSFVDVEEFDGSAVTSGGSIIKSL